VSFKFEELEVWHLALDYVDLIYEIVALLPRDEEFNLKSQIIRAATSVALNIAEGSTGQTDAEQARFLGIAIRSLIETVACQRIIERRHLIRETALLHRANSDAERLAAKIQAMRRAISPERSRLRDEPAVYSLEDGEQDIDNAR
jgi:four helix bundle protein